MIRYFKGRRVKVVRNFVVGGVNYSEVKAGVDTFVVRTAELTDEKEYPAIEIGAVDSYPEDVKNTFFNRSNDSVSSTVSDEDSSSSVKLNGEDDEGMSVIDAINNSTESVEITDEKIELSGETHVVEDTVVATNKKGKTFNLGAVSDLSESEQVKKLKLDYEAINRCLAGDQKQHKGFTFEIKAVEL